MRLYRLLLRAYPKAFRRLYGADLEADFEALRQRVRARDGRRGVARLWLRTIVDVLKTAARERGGRRGYRFGSSRLRRNRRDLAGASGFSRNVATTGTRRASEVAAAPRNWRV